MVEANDLASAPGNYAGACATPGSRFARLCQSRWQPLFLVAGVAIAAILVRLALHLRLPLPFCLMREMTGIPCPGCGATRSLLGWSHLNPLEALRFNPLFFVLTVGLVVWASATVVDRCLGTRWVERMQTVQKRWPTTRWLIAMLAANWLYLWLTLPK